MGGDFFFFNIKIKQTMILHFRRINEYTVILHFRRITIGENCKKTNNNRRENPSKKKNNRREKIEIIIIPI